MSRILLVNILFLFSLSNIAQTKHIVQRGETIELIASRYGISVSKLKEVNPLIEEFYTGLTLSIPPKPKSVESFVEIKKRKEATDKLFEQEASISQMISQSNGVWEGYVNSNRPTYNPYWNDEQMMWNIQHAQLQTSANAFHNQMMQSIQQIYSNYQPNYSWDNYQPNYSWNGYQPSLSWDDFVPGVDYSTMPVPVFDNMQTPIDVNTNTSSPKVDTHRTLRTCQRCDGKRTIVETKGVSSFGLDKWCSECNKKVSANHYHTSCPSCKGTGVW